ncbi:MAG: hypothetical protein ABIS45_01600 [Burkholderiales bacterium]
MGLMDMLTQVAHGGDNSQQFNEVAQNAPPDVLGKGVAAAFRSDQTPPIGEMVAKMFGQSSGDQQAGMLNKLLGALGPTVLASLAGGVLGKLMHPGQTQVTPEQAQQVSPQQVKEIVNHANDANPGVADQLGEYYAQHKGLITTLGGIAATVAMMKMKDHLSQR